MFKKIISTFGTKALAAVLNFLVVIVLSNQLGASGKGTCSLILTLIAIFIIINSFVGGPTLVYLIPRYSFSQLILPSYIWAFIVCGLFWVMLEATSVVPSVYNKHIIALSLLQSYNSIHLMVLLGKDKPIQNNLLTLFQVLISFLCLIIFYFLFKEPTVYNYILSLYVGFGISTLIGFFLIWPKWKNTGNVFSTKILIEIVRLGAINQIANIAQFLSYRLAFYFLNHYNNEATVGVFSNGVSIAESIWLFGNSIAMIQYSTIANQNDISDSQKLTVKMVKTNSILTLIAILFLLILPPQFYTFLFGNDFADIKSVILTLAPGIFSFSLTMILSTYYSGTGKYYINSIASGIGLIITFVFCFMLIPSYGIKGAGIASSASYIFTTIFIVIVFLNESKQKFSELIPSYSDFKSLKHFFKPNK